MTTIGIAILVIVLCITAVNLVIGYTCLVMMSPVKRIASEYKPKRVILRTLYGKDWNRIMEMTKIEKGAYKND